MLNFISKPGNVLTTTLALAALGSVAVVATFTVPTGKRNASSQEIPASILRSYLVRVGLDPGTLAGVGASAAETEAVVAGARGYLEQHLGSLRQADEARFTRAREVDELSRRASQGRASEQDLTNLATARTALGTAESEQQAAFSALFNAAAVNEIDPLEQSERSGIQAVIANRAREVPLRYRFASRSDADWVALRDGLIQERVHADRQEEVPAELANLLSGFRADSATVHANLESPTAANVCTAWESATAGD